MAASRLSPMLSTLWRSSEVYNPTLRSVRAAHRIQAYHPSRRWQQQEQIPQRYGTANEPPPSLDRGKATAPQPKQHEHQEAKPLPKIGANLQKHGEEEVEDERKGPNEHKREPTTIDGAQTSAMQDPMLGSSEPPGSPQATPDSNKPLESILQTVPDAAAQQFQHQRHQSDADHAEDHEDKSFDEHSPPIKAPHIEQPRYIHHFDTYGLVRRLTASGWPEDQAITAMKAMRMTLVDNTDLAKEALVSKSQLENEAYLFKAACAELKTEVTTRRKSEQEKMRTERTQLQHEVDIISQRLGQETTTLKDDLKGMFDDRKMAVRNEQRDMESKIQQANYRITVELQADAKSEVESLRWIMTRRVIFTLGIVVLMIVGSLKAASQAFVAQEQEEKRRAAGGNMRGAGTQTDFVDDGGRSGPAVVVKEGGSPGFVSLG